jgi:hypothetical protein
MFLFARAGVPRAQNRKVGEIRYPFSNKDYYFRQTVGADCEKVQAPIARAPRKVWAQGEIGENVIMADYMILRQQQPIGCLRWRDLCLFRCIA